MCTSRYLKWNARINLLFEKSVTCDRESLPVTVIATPVIFNGVNSSPKTTAETTMVVTSFAIPAMDIGTIPAR